MSDLTLKTIPAAAASSGPSVLASAQFQSHSVNTTPVSGLSVATNAAVAIRNAKSHEHVDLLKKAAENIQQYMPKQPAGTELRIEKDKGTNIFVYKSINPSSGEVVSQYPSEQILKFISYFRAKEGLAVDQSA